MAAVGLSACRKRLGRIRCVKECIETFKGCQPLPWSVCYVAAEREYRPTQNTKISLYAEANKHSKPVSELQITTDQRIIVSDEEFCNSQGQWAKFIKLFSVKGPAKSTIFNDECFLLLYNNETTSEETQIFTSVSKKNSSKGGLATLRWEDVVENQYSVQSQEPKRPSDCDAKAMEHLLNYPPNWSLDHDEDLALFLAAHTTGSNENLGSVKNYVESINVSTYSEEEGPENLTDGDSETYWESDGNQGQHWIRLEMKKGTIVKKLLLGIDGNDDNYMPSRIVVMGGVMDDLKKLNEISVDQSMYGLTDVVVLADQSEYHPVIEIRLKECKDDGIDTRIHGIKIKSSKEMDLGLNSEIFGASSLVRYPKLEGYPALVLYHRALVLIRFVALLDSVLPYVVPAWQYSVGSYASLETVRQFLSLSKKRMTLIETFLRESEMCRPHNVPKLYINRRAAMEHKLQPYLDPDCKNTEFNQIYEGLKPRDRFEKPLDYRWPGRHEQWWECKFLAEGIIDQGGGFRDSLSDIADELCPTASDVPVPLPFFVRSPNQRNQDSNVNRDVYVPDPACTLFHKYEWIGKLMGACLRGKEHLVLSLPSFVWKKLAGEPVKWSRDFVTVDEAEVKLIENMDTMDEETFNAYFGEDRAWTTTLSNGITVPLVPKGEEIVVTYEDRRDYSVLVQQTRMEENAQQIAAIRRGLLQVVPQAVLDLLTWQELEKRVCGDPDITVEALRRATHLEDLEESDPRVKYMWEALQNFSNEDRSRFLRFVTGRRRLPAPIYVCPDKGESVDALPESSTCAHTLYLPNYSSAKVAEDKIRYAAYNCIAIDTDLSPWDE